MHTEGKCVTVGTACCVIITRNSVHVILLPGFLSQIETEMDPNLGSSRLQQLKPDALLGSATNDL